MSEKKETIFKKIKTSAGFTLAEALVAILILLMVSSIVAAGIPAARNAYEKVVLASNAEVLMSTTISALRNELGTANNVEVDGTKSDGVTVGETIRYYNPSINATSMISLKSEVGSDGLADELKEDDVPDGVIVYQRHAGPSIDGTVSEKNGKITYLISKQASTDGLYVTYESVRDNGDGTITFNNLAVNQAVNGTDTKTGIAERNISIRVISY